MLSNDNVYVLLQAQSSDAQRKAAVDLLQQLSTAGEPLPDVAEVNELLRLCAAISDVDSVFKVISVMERHQVAGDEGTFVQLSEMFQYFPKKPPGES
ncbi:hypothetical protein QJQ45_020683 [Haematococcus lacustris]|nr:hypothetical protein QJQ45_020683 [Haematococcus lacustris]